MPPKPTPQAKIDQQAADWFVRLDDRSRVLSAREQARWLAWLQRSPRHLESFMNVAELYDRFEGIDKDSRFDVMQWLQQRRGETLDIGTRFARPSAPAWQAAIRSRTFALAASVCLAVLAAVSWWALSANDRYKTSIGEQRTVQLTDGSTIQLNTQSKVSVALGENSRVIELEGEATFTVAHDATRPFLVKTHDATTQAVGTKFNVYQENGRTRVAVVEGVVVVTPVAVAATTAATTVKAKPPRPLTIVAGDVVDASAGRVEHAPEADATAAISWQQHRLIFKDTSLGEIARQFNRYNAVQIEVAPAVRASIQLSGTFDAKQPGTWIRYLQGRNDVAIRQDGEQYRLEAK
ncbi:FecR family protein [Steroidobacter sp.]|uniref:FecR family protein n=1 Tax=Steroidobacter sp. TaxID=1978227 RepID=UPI001A4265E9|nr:FecR domain-containing protein [Steroidobacter sp.]MBL8270183.1 FecR domain-containing protein [Steroidobacter sp.]